MENENTKYLLDQLEDEPYKSINESLKNIPIVNKFQRYTLVTLLYDGTLNLEYLVNIPELAEIIENVRVDSDGETPKYQYNRIKEVI